MNLTEISIAFRKLLLVGIIVFVIFLILRFLFSLLIAYIKSTRITPPPAPTVRFNILPQPDFSSFQSTSGLTFILQNIDGRPPETTDSAKVYPMPKKLPTLLSTDRAKQFAGKLRFTKEPNIIRSTVYHYADPDDPLRTLDLDIVNMNFKLFYDFRNNPQFVLNKDFSLSKEKTINDVKQFIQYNGLFDETIVGGIITTGPLTYNTGTRTFSKVSSISEAQAIRVNFFRPDIDDVKVVQPGIDESFNYVLYTPTKISQTDFLQISYTFWPIAFDDYATYPLKSGAQAWQDLIDGYGFVARMGNNAPDRIIIRNIYLAYYDTESPQPYLQPIFVFEGDNDFVSYVAAILTDWLE